MATYSTDPEWADIEPIPTDEGGSNPLAGIAYSEEYSETMGYLRAVMARNEHSPRALALTQDLIEQNPAHYTVWLYRAAILEDLQIPAETELAWLDETALRHQKNYQIWHHRQTIVERRGNAAGERDFVNRMLALDAKNYHVWSYRQWLVRQFALWDDGEVEWTENLLREDVRNNSAWNHRWFVLQGRESEGVAVGISHDANLRDREVDFAKRAIALAPNNICPWNYIRAVLRKAEVPLGSLKEFVASYASLQEQPGGVKSSYALDILAEILAEEEDGREQAALALDLLAEKYDPIRKGYWRYRKGMLGLPGEAVAS